MDTRRRYRNPPIKEALCEFHFDPSEESDLTIPGKLHSKLGDEYSGKPRQQNVVQVRLSMRDEFRRRIQQALDAYWMVAKPNGVKRIVPARSSLAVSNEAVLMQSLYDAPYVPKSAIWGYARDTQRASTEWTDGAIARLERDLYAAFDSEVLEDGMDHPADDVLENALILGDDQPLLAWLSEVSLDAGRPSFAASLLRCLGRQTDPGTTAWRADLVRNALVVKNVQIRDAAVQAAEHWADPDLISVLGGHHDSEQWLAQYIDMVVNDLKTS